MEYLSQIKTKWLYSLKYALILGLAGTIVVGIALLTLFLRTNLLRDSERKTQELSDVVESSLENDMLERNPQAIQKTLEKIVQSSDSITHAFILNNSSRVAFSSDQGEIGKTYDRFTDESCRGCHQDPTQAPEQHAIIAMNSVRRIQRNVNVLNNQPACYPCHDESNRTTGKLIVDRSLKQTYALIAKIDVVVLVVGLGCLVFLTVILSKGLNRYVLKVLRQQEEMMALYTLVERLSKTLDCDEVRNIVAHVLSDLLDANEVDVVTPAGKGAYTCVAWSRADDRAVRKRIEADDPLKSAVGQWLTRADLQPTLADEARSVLMPIVRSDTPLALLAVRKLSEPFDPRRLWFIEIIANHIAVAFENARLYTMAITDEVTGLFSRRHFEYTLDRKLDECRKHGDTLGLLMIDIDDFKKVNDAYGHVAGDSVLSRIGECILASRRDSDLAFRYGGEEFSVILLATDAQGGVRVGERIREAVAAIEFDKGLPRITVSVGVACATDHLDTVQSLVLAADQALYEAKRLGKNRVIEVSCCVSTNSTPERRH